jgi:hypothetical protein
LPLPEVRWLREGKGGREGGVVAWIRDIESQLGQISESKINVGMKGIKEEGIMWSGMARWSIQIVARAIG